MSPRLIWSEPLSVGTTADGYRVEISPGSMPGKFVLHIDHCDGASLHQICGSAGAAKTNAETEIDHHRRRGSWTR